MHALRNPVLFIGRVLIAAVFLYDAHLILTNWDATVQYMTSHGLPSVLLPAVAFCQAIGGLMIVFGLWARLAALAFAAYCVATAVIFHGNLGDTGEMVQAGKDFAIAGGFLFLAMEGPGAWSLTRGR